MRSKIIFSVFLSFLLLLPLDDVFAVNFNYSGGPQKLIDMMKKADDGWERHLTDNVTVNVKVQWNTASMGKVTAQTKLNLIYADYSKMRDRMILDEYQEKNSNGLVRWLPDKDQFKADIKLFNSKAPIIFASQANWKALGFKGADFFHGKKDKYGNQWNNEIDATITFNRKYFDGKGADERDFNTMASHELGHVLGFYSILDKGLTAGPTTLDLFRFERDSVHNDNDIDIPTNLWEFRTNERNLNPNGVVVFLVVDYDLSKSTFIQYMMSNTNHGRQASHWADRSNGGEIGVMDPGSVNKEGKVVIKESLADFYALDLIGWDVDIFKGAKLGWNEYYRPPDLSMKNIPKTVSEQTVQDIINIIKNGGDFRRVPPEYLLAASSMLNNDTVPENLRVTDEMVAMIEDALRKQNIEIRDVHPPRIDSGRRIDAGCFAGWTVKEIPQTIRVNEQ